MRSFLKKVLGRTMEIELELEPPARFPDFNNVHQWMEAKVNYFAKKDPDLLYILFCPSCVDYLPRTIAAGTSTRVFNEHLDYYRALKAMYPDAVLKAKEQYDPGIRSLVGDNEDFPY